MFLDTSGWAGFVIPEYTRNPSLSLKFIILDVGFQVPHIIEGSMDDHCESACDIHTVLVLLLFLL
jgi:hypothetical protein